MKRRPLIYIASPYTKGNSFVNTRRQIDAAEDVANWGGVPMWPLSNAFWNFVYPHPPAYWMAIDRELLARCDALWRLDGDSTGADLEVNWAIEFSLPVFAGEEMAAELLEAYIHNFTIRREYGIH